MTTSPTHLIEATDADFADLLAGNAPHGLGMADGGIESAETLTMLRGLAVAVRANYSPAAWLLVRDHHIVGLCSLLHAPDTSGSIAIGYGVAASCRGQGIGRDAIADLVRWAKTQPDVLAITAETNVANIASQRMLETNGFTTTGTRVDGEDGDLICWSCSTCD